MCNDIGCGHLAGVSRRGFVRMVAGATAALATAPALANGKAKALMLSCMDYRLVDDLVTQMECRGMHDAYDHVVLAGASLGVVAPDFAAWHQVFWDHLDLAIKLHGIEEVIVINHRDCGAFKLVMGELAVATPEDETRTHSVVLSQFAAEVRSKHPDLGVKAYLMGLDGFAETIALAEA